MRLIISKKGFTLIEIMVAIFIISILASVFLGAFANGFSNIIYSGKETKAISDAQSCMDNLWQDGENGSITNTSDLVDKFDSTWHKCLTSSELYTYSNNKNYYYTTITDNGINFIKLTLVVFYRNGNSHVTLTSYIPLGGL